MTSQNPFGIPPEKIVWKNQANSWENPLKVALGPSTRLRAVDGRPFIDIAELYAPDKCTYHCHPDNFTPMCNLAKRIALGEVTEP